MLPVIWITCAAVVIFAAIRSRRHPSARRTGRYAVAGLYVGAGAAVNAFLLLRGDDYAKFADGSAFSFVRHTWRDLVVPSHTAWISLLIAFELGVGVLAVLGGHRTQVAYGAAIAFHVALLSFGWGFALWSVPMVSALVALLRAERRAEHLAGARPSAASRGQATPPRRRGLSHGRRGPGARPRHCGAGLLVDEVGVDLGPGEATRSR